MGPSFIAVFIFGTTTTFCKTFRNERHLDICRADTPQTQCCLRFTHNAKTIVVQTVPGVTRAKLYASDLPDGTSAASMAVAVLAGASGSSRTHPSAVSSAMISSR
jgi:hypothetical protein